MDASNSGQSRRFAGATAAFDPDQRHYGFSKGSSTAQDTGDTPIPWNIMQFYNQNQDPWHPPNIIMPDSQVSRKLPGSVGFQSSGPSFQGFRSNHLPSECDTLPEDSGYGGSRPPYSIENTSVYEEDRNPEAQITAHRIEALQLHPDTSNETQLQQWAQPRRPTNITATAGTGDNRNHCPECNNWFRTKSEYKSV